MNTQIKLQESVTKSCFLSSIAGITRALQVWGKFSTNEDTKDKPELNTLIWVLGSQTFLSFTLLYVQMIDNSHNLKRRIKSQTEDKSHETGLSMYTTLALLIIDAGLETWEIYLMFRLQADY